MLTAPARLNRLSADSVFWTRFGDDCLRIVGRSGLNRLSADSVFWTRGKSGVMDRAISLNRLSADSVFWTVQDNRDYEIFVPAVSTAFRLIRSFGLARRRWISSEPPTGLNRLSADSVFWTERPATSAVM